MCQARVCARGVTGAVCSEGFRPFPQVEGGFGGRAGFAQRAATQCLPIGERLRVPEGPMTKMRRKLLAASALVVLSGLVPAAAQTYPDRPVTFIVPYGAGGPLDAVARIITERMRVPLKQSTVIENVTGASGTVGVGRAVRAAPDGYTVCVGNWPTHVVNGAMFDLTYDLVKDFEPVALLTSNPYIMLVRKDLPAKNMAEMIAFLKANPGGLTL